MNSRSTISDAELRDALALDGQVEAPPRLYDVLDGIARSRPRPRTTPSAVRLLIAAALAALAAGALFLASGGGPSPLPTASPTATPWMAPAGLVTEQVEDGVERITGDGAEHRFEGVSDVAFGPDGAVWVLGAHGLFQVGKSGSFPGPAASLAQAGSQDLAVASDGTLWASDGNVVSFADGSWTTHPGLGQVRDLEVARDGLVWALGATMLGRLDDDGWTTSPLAEPRAQMPAGRSLASLATTPEGDVWVATSVCRDLCVLQLGGGLARFDGTSWTLVRPLGDVVDEPTLKLATGADGSLWVYGEYARQDFGDPMQPYLAHLVGESWTVYGPSEGVPRIGHPGAWGGRMVVGVDGALWVTTESGLQVFDGTTWTARGQGLPCCEDLPPLVAAPDGNVWFLSNGTKVYIVRR